MEAGRTGQTRSGGSTRSWTEVATVGALGQGLLLMPEAQEIKGLGHSARSLFLAVAEMQSPAWFQ